MEAEKSRRSVYDVLDKWAGPAPTEEKFERDRRRTSFSYSFNENMVSITTKDSSHIYEVDGVEKSRYELDDEKRVDLEMEVVSVPFEEFIAELQMTEVGRKTLEDKYAIDGKVQMFRISSLKFCGSDILKWMEDKTGKKCDIYCPTTELTENEKLVIDDETDGDEDFEHLPLWVNSAAILSEDEAIRNSAIIMRPPVGIAGVAVLMHEWAHIMKGHGSKDEQELLELLTVIQTQTGNDKVRKQRAAIQGSRESEAWSFIEEHDTTWDIVEERYYWSFGKLLALIPELERFGLAITTKQARFANSTKFGNFVRKYLGLPDTGLIKPDDNNDVTWSSYDNEMEKGRNLVAELGF